jgi:hypothetical protein
MTEKAMPKPAASVRNLDFMAMLLGVVEMNGKLRALACFG